MRDLSMHIMDIAQNSVRAKASEVTIDIAETGDTINIMIADNGIGMDAQTVALVTDPFFTSRTTRHVGLGLPLMKQSAEQTGGGLSIESAPGKGTVVATTYIKSNIDCLPWGNLPQTITLLMVGHPTVNFIFRYKNNDIFSISTNDITEAVGADNIHNAKAIKLIENIINDNIGEAGFNADL